MSSGGRGVNRFLEDRSITIHKKPKSLSEKRPPNWEREELTLALELYFKLSPNQFEETNSQIIELSLLLNKRADILNLEKSEKFRNPVGVKSKLNNFLFLDKGKGRSNIGSNDRLIWGEYLQNKEKLYQEAKIIRRGIEERSIPVQSSKALLDQEASDFPEGAIHYYIHKRRERNTKFIRQIKNIAEKNGQLHCEICGFDFHQKYGDIGKGFIECHHLKPLSEYNSDEKTTKENLVLICSNCHKMLHKYRPWLGRNDLKTILKD